MMQRKPRARSTGRTIDHLESCGTTESQLTAETHFGPRRSWTKRTGRTHHRLRTYNEIDSVTVVDERALNEAVSLEELVSKKGGSGGIVQDLLCRRRINSIPPECAVPAMWQWGGNYHNGDASIANQELGQLLHLPPFCHCHWWTEIMRWFSMFYYYLMHLGSFLVILFCPIGFGQKR